MPQYSRLESRSCTRKLKFFKDEYDQEDKAISEEGSDAGEK